MSEVYIYILVMALTSFAIRVLPLTLIQTEITTPPPCTAGLSRTT